MAGFEFKTISTRFVWKSASAVDGHATVRVSGHGNDALPPQFDVAAKVENISAETAKETLTKFITRLMAGASAITLFSLTNPIDIVEESDAS